jgi:serine/threonine-protein kinase 19
MNTLPEQSNETRKRKLEERKTVQKRRRIQLEESQPKTTLMLPSLPNNTSSKKRSPSTNSAASETTEYSILDNEFGADEDVAEALTSDKFSSTNLAMQKLRGLFPSQLRQLRLQVTNFKFIIAPIILRHMLYAMVEDRTEVDRQIDEYLKENRIRQFHLYTLGRDAIGYVFTEDYVNTVKQILAAQRQEKDRVAKSNSPPKKVDKFSLRLRQQRKETETKLGNKIDTVDTMEELEQLVLERFEKDLLPKCRDTYISRDQVRSLLACQDKHVSILVKLGLLTIRDESTFWFGVPNAGLFLDYLVKGREELITMLKRKKYKEMMLHAMESTPLKKSPLGNIFHIRDLLGSGCAECVMTSNGAMIGLRKTTKK